MKSMILFFTGLLLFGCVNLYAASPEKISFESEDGLLITAEKYMAYPAEKAPMIVLFHQAGWSRGEYREIAPKLNALGFNCLAIDQRSGKGVNGVINETAERANKKGVETTYIEALPDMRAALKYARKMGAPKVIGWGSSYSAGLVIYLAGSNPGLMDAVLAFSPGEYFTRMGKPDNWVAQSASNIKIPVFITSAAQEKGNWEPIFNAIPSENKTGFVPQTKGNHGSRALWAKWDDHDSYWDVVKPFLIGLKD